MISSAVEQTQDIITSDILIHWGLEKMVAIAQMIFSNVFLHWKCLKFDWSEPMMA